MAQLSGTQEAINMLHVRIKLLLRYLNAVKNGSILFFISVFNFQNNNLMIGELPKDLHFLRQIKSICLMLPAIDTNEFKKDLLDVCYFYSIFACYKILKIAA